MDLFDYGYYSDMLKECFNKYGKIFDLPVIENPYSEAVKYYKDGNILDMGAGKAKIFQTAIHPHINNGQYYSLDNDQQGEFDFNHVTEISNGLKFSFVIANQFFEHLSIEESMNVLQTVYLHLVDSAVVVITVPNIAHPNRFISNIDHKTAWGFNSLYSILKKTNYAVIQISRYSKRSPKGLLEKFLAYHIGNIYRMDWADSIFMVGQKNG